ncbi:acyl-CoA carboxylase subunit epsilon [Streptomyces sp. NPDC046939]|uniref:acyl-CoA carboxylase subunit epsilon n=1 Tax=Streptomyces sp. NPDC046939 TaxID=3155376 RepID=UPI0033C4A895
MEDTGRKGTWLRIERGHATEEELAAVTVTLLSLAAGRGESHAEGVAGRSTASWGRREWVPPYRSPSSWR